MSDYLIWKWSCYLLRRGVIFLVLWYQCILSLPVGLFNLIKKIWPIITKHCYYIAKFSPMAKADLNIVMWELKWSEVEPILFASEASPLTPATSLRWILDHTPESASAYSRNYSIKICIDKALLLTNFLLCIFFHLANAGIKNIICPLVFFIKRECI